MTRIKTALLSGAGLLALAGNVAAQELTVWDWKSGDPATFGYYDAAKEAFEAANPGATVKFVVQPHDQYYTLLGTALASGEGPDVVLLHGGSQTQSRAAALVDPTAMADGFSGTDAFANEARCFALPITIQGFAVYYNKAHYEAAGLDGAKAPANYEDLIATCDAIIAKDEVPCFALGNKQGFGGEFFISQIATSTFDDADYAAWIAGELPWTSPKVRQIVELWADGNARGWFNEGANSIAKFMDEYERFMRGEAAHTVGLLSDVAHWKQFEEFLGEGNVGVFAYPNPEAELARLPFGGGIGWGVPASGEHQELAMSLVDILTDAERQAIFAVDTGALPANTAVDTSTLSSAALSQALDLMASAPGGSPHALLNPAVLEEWKRQSQLLLNGKPPWTPLLTQWKQHDRQTNKSGGSRKGDLALETSTQVNPPRKRRARVGSKAESRVAFLFLLPALLLVLVFRIFPLGWGFVLSLTDTDSLGNGDWVGFANYTRAAKDPTFQDSLVNTLLLIATLPIWVMLPMLLAILIHQGVPGGKIFRAVYFFPAVLSSVIIGSIFNIVLRYDGSLNNALEAIGISAVDWLGGSSTALGSLIAVQLWSTFGMGVLIFMSGLSTVPSDIIEAARIDGARFWQRLFLIIVPTLRPIIEFVAVVTTIGVLTSMFGLIYVLTGGGPGTATTLPEFLIWLEQGKLNRPGYASAISMILFVMMGGIAWMQIRIMTRNANL